MDVALYVAVARNGIVGHDGGMPWRLSTDLKRFKASTMGKPVIMGRKTWDSLPRQPLPGRLNIVVTRNRDPIGKGAVKAGSLEEALELAGGSGETVAEAAVIGGGEIYRLAMEIADRLHVTHVEAELEGDTEFPEIDPTVWLAVSSEALPASEKDSHPTRHVIYERRRV